MSHRQKTKRRRPSWLTWLLDLSWPNYFLLFFDRRVDLAAILCGWRDDIFWQQVCYRSKTVSCFRWNRWSFRSWGMRLSGCSPPFPCFIHWNRCCTAPLPFASLSRRSHRSRSNSPKNLWCSPRSSTSLRIRWPVVHKGFGMFIERRFILFGRGQRWTGRQWRWL